MTENLQPCPFCGGKAKWRYIKPQGYVFCVKCGTSTGIYSDTYEEADCKTDAITAWNLRAQPAQPKDCAAMERVEGGIPYCSDKQTACDGCAQPANEPLTHEEISKICLRNYIRKREEEREHD